ncbi:MAG: SDR family oxidoreductase [Bacteroidia bacterium]|nr:SDR family oxidoreductase [Bacteroidia bacterium]
MTNNNGLKEKNSFNKGMFDNKVSLITGGARGIGYQIAKDLASQGSDIIICDIATKQMEESCEKIRALGVRCVGYICDVTNWEQIKAVVDKGIKEFKRIDILINNAGTIRPAEFLNMSEEDWDFLQNVDLRGLVGTTLAVAPYMIEQNYGKIVNVSSMSAFGVYMSGFASYSAAKAAVVDFTKTSARELGRYKINVNGVSPGEIMTELTYQDQTIEEVEIKLKRSEAMAIMGRIGQPEDVANLVLFLASDKASFITGETINIDGGRIDRM